MRTCRSHSFHSLLNVDFWTWTSAWCYVFGGLLFIFGSICTVPDLPEEFCVTAKCKYDVALWYLIGCTLYLLAAVVDLSLQFMLWRRKFQLRTVRYGVFRCDQYTEGMIAGVIYLFGGTFFVIGSVLFFPEFDMTFAARLIFRLGSICYILGSLYGVIQLLLPQSHLLGKEGNIIRNRTMTHFDVLVPLSNLISSMYRPIGKSGEMHHQDSIRSRACGLQCIRRIDYGLFLRIIVKVVFMCGSSLFISGGVLFQEGNFVVGANLWIIGSVMFLLGAIVSLYSIWRDKRRSKKMSTIPIVEHNPSGSTSTTPALNQPEENVELAIANVQQQEHSESPQSEWTTRSETSASVSSMTSSEEHQQDVAFLEHIV